MTMVFCRGCAKQIHETAPTCPGCGAPQHIPGAAATAGPGKPAETPEQLWERRFALIEKAGGHKLPKVWTLPGKEIFTVKFNLWALILGPFYYAAQGMWKRGVSYTAVAAVAAIGITILVEALGINGAGLWLMVPGFLCGQANVSYFRLKRLGSAGWW